MHTRHARVNSGWLATHTRAVQSRTPLRKSAGGEMRDRSSHARKGKRRRRKSESEENTSKKVGIKQFATCAAPSPSPHPNLERLTVANN